MGFDSERSATSALQAYAELERLVRHLEDELAAFRRRALHAEARLRAIDGSAEPAETAADAAGAPAEPEHAERLGELERENAELRQRLDAAAARTRQMLERVRFLRQQQGSGGRP